MNENLLRKIKLILDSDENIVYGEGTSYKIQYNGQKNYSTAQICIYLNKKREIAIIWNLKRQRDCGHKITSQTLSKNWENVLPIKEEIKVWYKRMGTDFNDLYEKVLAMSFDTLFDNINYLSELLEFDFDDSEFPKELKREENLNKQPRTRITAERWNRDVRFRKKVLEAYGNQCAICRCKEKKVLEGAHIKAVYDGGNDEVKNGICLCRNHHVMFDKGLISIDFTKLELVHVEDTVKSMAWYKEFVNKYNQKILSPMNYLEK